MDEQRATEQRAAVAEQRAAEQRAAEQRAAEQRAAEQRALEQSELYTLIKDCYKVIRNVITASDGQWTEMRFRHEKIAGKTESAKDEFAHIVIRT
jgi:hypothetical protein